MLTVCLYVGAQGVPILPPLPSNLPANTSTQKVDLNKRQSTEKTEKKTSKRIPEKFNFSAAKPPRAPDAIIAEEQKESALAGSAIVDEQKRKAQALADLNQQAASGDIFAIKTLLHFAPLGEDARPGLAAAASAGSSLAKFITAVWDFNANGKSPSLQARALDDLRALSNYFPAKYWLATNTSNNLTPTQLVDLLTPRPKSEGLWVDHLEAMLSCKNAEWKACLARLDALKAKGWEWTDYPYALVFLHGSEDVRDIRKGRERLEAAYKKDRGTVSSEQRVLLAWLTLKGIGGVADTKIAIELFGSRGSTYVPRADPIASLEAPPQGCSDLKTEPGSFYTLSAYPGGFSVYGPVFKSMAPDLLAQALSTCQKQADAGDANAMSWMGSARERCIPSCDSDQRNQWFAKAAAAGSKYAALATIAFADKKTLAVADQAFRKYSREFNADTLFAARYNLAMADDALQDEREEILKQIKSRADVWQKRWLQGMMVALIEGKKIKEMELGDVIRAYATQILLIDAQGNLNPNWKLYNLRSEASWFNIWPWPSDDVFRSQWETDDENYYALKVARCGSWTRGLGCSRIAGHIRTRAPNLIIQAGSDGVATGEYFLSPNGTVRQVSKGLEWLPCGYGASWSDASRQCQGTPKSLKFTELKEVIAQINGGKGEMGNSDWRLPTMVELRGLVECRYGYSAKSQLVSEGRKYPRECHGDPLNRPQIRDDIFPNLQGDYWSSTATGRDGSKRLSVNLDTGWIHEFDKDVSSSVLLVRTFRP